MFPMQGTETARNIVFRTCCGICYCLMNVIKSLIQLCLILIDCIKRCGKDLPEITGIINALAYLWKQHHLPQSTINMKLFSQPKSLFDTTHCDITFTISDKSVTRYLELKPSLLTV